MKLKKQVVRLLVFIIVLLFVTSCKKKQEEMITQPADEIVDSKIQAYMPSQVEAIDQFTEHEVTDFAWEVYNALVSIGPNTAENKTIYDEIEKKYFLELKKEKKTGFFPWFEDILFNRMNFEHVKIIGEDIVCSRKIEGRNYYLVQLAVLGNYNYELTSNSVVENKSGLTTMVLHMMLGTTKEGTLGYYSLISFNKEPQDIKVEIQMFNGIIDAEDEKNYLNATEENPNSLKELTLQEQYEVNNNRLVMVYAQQKDGSIRQANGIYIHQYLIITPLGMVENCTNIWVATNNNELIESVGVVDTSEELDLALIKLENDLSTEVSPFTIGNLDVLEASDLVYILGSDKGYENVIKQGMLTNFWTYEDIEYYQTTIPIDQTDSGAALLDTFGQLVGIVSNRIPSEDGFIQSIEYVNYFKQYLANKGKDAELKTTFAAPIEPRTISELRRLHGYILVYSNTNIPSDLAIDKSKSTLIAKDVESSIENRNEYISGNPSLPNNAESDNEKLYFSPEMHPLELDNLRTLKKDYTIKNIEKTELTDYMIYDDIQILAISGDLSEPYVLIKAKVSLFDKDQSLSGPIKTFYSKELMKYNATNNVFQLVGTVD